MSKHTAVGAVLLVITLPVTARTATLEVEQAKVHESVKAYLNAVAEGSEAEAAKRIEFTDEKERAAFRDQLAKGNLRLAWDRKQQPHLVRYVQEGDRAQVLYLFPTTQGYLPTKFSVREVDGQLKFTFASQKQMESEKLDVITAKRKELENSLSEWEAAHGPKLTEEVRKYKAQLQDEIDALAFAKQKGLKVVPGLGDLGARLSAMETIKDKDDEEVRAIIVRELKAALESLK